jgi:hypothetical protein
MIFGSRSLTLHDVGRVKYRRRFAWYPRRIRDGRRAWLEYVVEKWRVEYARDSYGIFCDAEWRAAWVVAAQDFVIPEKPAKEEVAHPLSGLLGLHRDAP